MQEAEQCYENAIKSRNIYPDAYYNLGNMVCYFISFSLTAHFFPPNLCLVYTTNSQNTFNQFFLPAMK